MAKNSSDGSSPDAVTVQEIALWAITNSPILLGDYLDLSDTEIDRLRDSLKQQPGLEMAP